ncbi:hypothetical protein ACQP1U_16725 [Actinomycetota bacterium]
MRTGNFFGGDTTRIRRAAVPGFYYFSLLREETRDGNAPINARLAVRVDGTPVAGSSGSPSSTSSTSQSPAATASGSATTPSSGATAAGDQGNATDGGGTSPLLLAGIGLAGIAAGGGAAYAVLRRRQG